MPTTPSFRSTPPSVVAVLLAAVLALVAPGCGSDSSPASQPPEPSESLGGAFYGQRALNGGISVECYTFGAEGTVELRHGGTPAVNDVGTYSSSTATVAWDSGRVSAVELHSGGVAIDGIPVSPIETCTP
jgi:hypothetical protein